MRSSNPLTALLAGLTVSLISAASLPAAVVMFDIDAEASGANGPGPTQTGWASATFSGGTISGTGSGVTLTGTGFNGGRVRGTNPAGVQGADNNDNQVPVGVYGDMWQDIGFSTGASVTMNLSGLNPATEYLITVYGYGSGQGSSATNWGPVGDVTNLLSFQGDLVGPGPDPNTDLLTDYNVTFSVTTDGSGAATFIGDRVTTITVINGLSVNVIPEPSSAMLLGAGAVALFLRRRR